MDYNVQLNFKRLFLQFQNSYYLQPARMWCTVKSFALSNKITLRKIQESSVEFYDEQSMEIKQG